MTTTMSVTYERRADEAAETRASERAVRFLQIARRRYLALDGNSPPGSASFRVAIGSLPMAATSNDIHRAVEAVRAEQNEREFIAPTVLDWEEGPTAQILHVGPYDAEYPTIERLTAAISHAGLVPNGCHHEVYLGGPSTPPSRTRTVISMAVAPAEDAGRR